MAELIFAGISLVAVFALAMNRAPLWLWALGAALFTFTAQMGLVHGQLHWPMFPWWSLLGWLIAALLFVASFPEIKRKYITLPTYRALQGAMPTISQTEREALQAGTVGWDAELFGGTPNWSKLRRTAPITLTPRSAPFSTGRPSSSASASTIGASATSCTTSPTMCGASCASKASSAC